MDKIKSAVIDSINSYTQETELKLHNKFDSKGYSCNIKQKESNQRYSNFAKPFLTEKEKEKTEKIKCSCGKHVKSTAVVCPKCHSSVPKQCES